MRHTFCLQMTIIDRSFVYFLLYFIELLIVAIQLKAATGVFRLIDLGRLGNANLP